MTWGSILVCMTAAGLRPIPVNDLGVDTRLYDRQD